MSTDTVTKMWAEIGEWTRGEPALIVMRGTYEADARRSDPPIDPPELLHEVPLTSIDEDWAPQLAALGWREVRGARHEATEYGIAVDIEPINDLALDNRPDADTIRDWLGPVELTADQLERFLAVWDDVTQRYGDDEWGEAAADLTAAVQYLLGETDAAAAGLTLTQARTNQAEATAAARRVAILAAQDGATDTDLAAALGVDRARTIRRWLGKA